jgi:hypothetical protein
MTESVAGLRKAIVTYSTPFGAFRNGPAPKAFKCPPDNLPGDFRDPSSGSRSAGNAVGNRDNIVLSIRGNDRLPQLGDVSGIGGDDARGRDARRSPCSKPFCA